MLVASTKNIIKYRKTKLKYPTILYYYGKTFNNYCLQMITIL